jgi:3-oxoacid CoA-transferase subunit A
MSIYITGDTHSQIGRIREFCSRYKTTTEDIMVVLGDAAFNYYLNNRDDLLKKEANSFPVTWFCIKGNHEKYAGAISNYIEGKFHGGTVYYEADYPNILFAKDGEVYIFDEKKVLVIGGAYSPDYYYRMAYNLEWFDDEQPSEETKKIVEDKLSELDYEVDYIFSHTVPLRYLPYEWFLGGIDQATVDHSTEEWLDSIYEQVNVKKWYVGHFHGSKVINEIRFMFEDYVQLSD